MQKSNIVRNNAYAAAMLSIVVLAFGLFAPKAHAAILPEELSFLEVQVDSATSLVAELMATHGQVAGVSLTNTKNQKLILAQQKLYQIQIKALNDQITALTKLRDTIQAKLDAITTPVEEPAASCTLTTDAASYMLGDTITFSWTSKNATSIVFVPDTSGKETLAVPTGTQKLNGSTPITASVIGNPVITMKVTTKGGKTATCTKTIPITQEDDSEGDTDQPDVSLRSVSARETLVVNSDTTTSDDAGLFELTFEVTAVNSDIYIKNVARTGSVDLTAGANFLLYDTSSNLATGTITATLTSTAASPSGYFQIAEGETEDFTLTVSFDPAVSGQYKLQMTSLNWSRSTDGTIRDTEPTPATSYDTNVLVI